MITNTETPQPTKPKRGEEILLDLERLLQEGKITEEGMVLDHAIAARALRDLGSYLDRAFPGRTR